MYFVVSTSENKWKFLSTSDQASANSSASQSSCHLFLYSLRTKNSFYIFKRLAEVKTVFCGMCKIHDIQIPVSINKMLLEHSLTHLFTCYFWLLLRYNSRMEFL